MHGIEFNDLQVGVSHDGAPARTAPVSPAGRDATARCAAVTRALRGIWEPQGDAAAWVALTPQVDPALAGELLHQLRGAGIVVQGFVDSAAQLAAALALDAPLVVPELSRHHLCISLAGADGGDAALRRHVQLAGGEQALHDAWLELAAATLVQQTRFDPLHDQRHESQLREQLPVLAAQARQAGQAEGRVGEHSFTLTRDQFATAAAPWLRPLASALQSLSAASSDAVLLVPAALREVPGLDEALAGARFARAFSGADGISARAASGLAPSGVEPDGAVPWRTRLPRLAPEAAAEWLQPLVVRGEEPNVMATHVVHRGRVLAIPATGLVLGRDPGEGQVLRLPEGIAGLSRRHCTLLRDGHRTLIIDHSSHGSFIDGVRVRGRALLAAGSTLRLGEPGVELALVAVDGAAAGG